MFEALIITLREGVEAALLMAIAISVLRRGGQERAIPALFAGAGLALAASIGVAMLAARISWNEDLAEGIAMLVGAVLVGSLVAWMWRAGPHFKDEIEAGLGRATGGGGAITGGVLGVFLFAFGMVFREGVETAIFLAATTFNSQGVGQWIGAIAGLALAVGFGVLFVRGTVRVPLKPFFSLTSSVLLLIAIELFVGGLHELSETEVIPSSRAEMAIVGPIVKNELLVFALTVAIAAGWLLFGPRLATAAAADDATGPQARLARAARARERNGRRAIGVVGLLVVAALSTAFVRQAQMPGKAPAEPVALTGGATSLDVSAARDGHLHFYQATSSGGPVRFFVLQVNHDLKVCADACEICGDKGYFESGGSIVCRNCTAPIAPGTIGRTGGCNPIPIPHHLDGDRLVVTDAELKALVPRLKGR